MSPAASASESCSVCGRTILAGELPRNYLTRDGEPRTVCELCFPRAEAAGWIPEGRSFEAAPAAGERERGRGWMRRMLERARESAAIAASREPERDTARTAQTTESEAVGGAAPRRRGGSGRQHSVPQSPELRIRRAFEVFNSSAHRRTVAGLIRSLGRPSVAAVTNGATPAEVRITVAWELAWYQWDVDLSRDGEQISAVAKGDEIEEIAEDDRRWNAHASEAGELEIGGAEELEADA